MTTALSGSRYVPHAPASGRVQPWTDDGYAEAIESDRPNGIRGGYPATRPSTACPETGHPPNDLTKGDRAVCRRGMSILTEAIKGTRKGMKGLRPGPPARRWVVVNILAVDHRAPKSLKAGWHGDQTVVLRISSRVDAGPAAWYEF